MLISPGFRFKNPAISPYRISFNFPIIIPYPFPAVNFPYNSPENVGSSSSAFDMFDEGFPSMLWDLPPTMGGEDLFWAVIRFFYQLFARWKQYIDIHCYIVVFWVFYSAMVFSGNMWDFMAKMVVSLQISWGYTWNEILQRNIPGDIELDDTWISHRDFTGTCLEKTFHPWCFC